MFRGHRGACEGEGDVVDWDRILDILVTGQTSNRCFLGYVFGLMCVYMCLLFFLFICLDIYLLGPMHNTFY